MKGLEAMLGVPKKEDAEPAGDGLEDAMSDLGEALADKDWSAAASAFKRASGMCGDDYDDEDEADEE